MKKFILVAVLIAIITILVKAMTKVVETENKFSSHGPDYFNPEYRYGWDRVG